MTTWDVIQLRVSVENSPDPDTESDAFDALSDTIDDAVGGALTALQNLLDERAPGAKVERV